MSDSLYRRTTRTIQLARLLMVPVCLLLTTVGSAAWVVSSAYEDFRTLEKRMEDVGDTLVRVEARYNDLALKVERISAQIDALASATPPGGKPKEEGGVRWDTSGTPTGRKAVGE